MVTKADKAGPWSVDLCFDPYVHAYASYWHVVNNQTGDRISIGIDSGLDDDLYKQRAFEKAEQLNANPEVKRITFQDSVNEGFDTIEIPLKNYDGKEIKIWLKIAPNTLYIGIEGHGEHTALTDHDASPMAIDVLNYDTAFSDSEAAVYVWEDINEEQYTRRISLREARLEKRKDDQ